MCRLSVKVTVLVLALVCCMQIAAAEPVDEGSARPSQAESGGLGVLTLPPADGPVVVRARFDIEDIADLNVGEENFEITGVLSLEWNDPRQGFDPSVEGVTERIFQGNFQFDEISPGWYPQIVLVNESGMFQENGVLLRVQPDGTSTLIQTVDAVAEGTFDMTFFPFDTHRLDLVFEVLWFDGDEVRMQVDSNRIDTMSEDVGIPQWLNLGYGQSVRERPAVHAGAAV